MERAIPILIVIALSAMFMWRVVFMLLEPVSTPLLLHRKDELGKRRGSHWLLPSMNLTAGSGWRPINLLQAKGRADMYLHRVIALTGATQKGNRYLLDVGTTRFELSDRFIGRLRESGDPKGNYEETCFYPAFQGMPKAEQIATALLQLRNNPDLFEKWVKKDMAFKADGQPFHRGK